MKPLYPPTPRRLLAAAALLCALWLTGCAAAPPPTPAASPAPTASPAPSSAPTATPEPPDIPIDFAALQAQNPDAYGWILIPGTLVDDPLLQHAEQTDYYLEHTLEGKPGLPGALYTRNDTPRDFSAPCTIVYGHNMADGSMFGSLPRHENSDFFADETNRTVHTYTPNSSREWTIFAAVEYPGVLLTYAFDFSQPAEVERFIAELAAAPRGFFDPDVPADGASRLLVLSTCVTGGREDYRYLVAAVLTGEQVAP